MRLLVCGSRYWLDYRLIAQLFARMAPNYPEVVIHGCARGADTMAGEIAQELGIPVLRFPADWDKHGKAAGIIRNQQMLDEGKPDLVVAFSRDIVNSKGTADMLRRAKAAGIRTVLFTG